MSADLRAMPASKRAVARLILVGSVFVFVATILIWVLSMMLQGGYLRLTRAWFMIQELSGKLAPRAPVVLLDAHGAPVVAPDIDVELINDRPAPAAAPEAAPAEADRSPLPPVEYNDDGTVRRTL